jgi:hypothetical protein
MSRRVDDVYVLKRVLMDWSDDLAIEALANCRDVMLDDGKVLVVEPVMPPGNAPSVSKTIDMSMLVLQHGGLVRTEREHSVLFAAAGLHASRITPTASPLCVIEGIHR